MLNYAHQFIKIKLVFSTRLITETKLVTPNFYFISETSKALSVRSRSLKKIIEKKIFPPTPLKCFIFQGMVYHCLYGPRSKERFFCLILGLKHN